MTEDAKTRALDKISRLATEPRSLVTFWDNATEVLKSTVPHYTYPCWYTLDPASLLITSHYNPFMPELPPDALALEYYGDDVNQIVDVARAESGISTLHEATHGDPSGSPRWQANSALGADQEWWRPCVRSPARHEVRSASTGNPTSRYSTLPRSASFRALPRTLPRAPADPCSSARRSTRRARTPPACSSSPPTGTSNPARPASSSGSTTYPTAMPAPAGCPPPSSPSPPEHCEMPRANTHPRWPWPGSSLAPEPGSSCTVRPCSPDPSHVSPSSSNPPTPPGSLPCSWPPTDSRSGSAT